MKKFLIFGLLTIALVSCQSVRVSQDYALDATFSQYKTYAYFKQGIDDVQVSELDKKRILRAIDAEMLSRGFTKSQDNPDMIISFFTDSQERVDVYNNMGFGWGGWGWGAWGGWGAGWGNNVSRTTEGVLYIDLIDGKRKELIWQGVGRAALKTRPEDKVERTNLMVKEILEQYPPQPKRNS
ncbi:MAG: DUF4136 domain-containing protein [Nonlabens sp.]